MPSWKKVVLHGSSGSLAHLTLENLTSQSVLATDASGNVIAGSISGYTLPTASTSTLGGIKVGTTLTISSGILDAKAYTGAIAAVPGEVPGTAGTAGYVPAATAAQASYFLKGDGTWAVPTNTVTRLRADNASSLLAGDFIITGSGATTVGYNNGVFTISSTDHDTTYSLFSGASASVNGAAGLVPGPRTGDQIKFLKGDGTWAVTPNTTYSTATSAALGLVKIGFTESGKDYPVELNASGQMFVNVPWSDTNTDTNTTYTIEGNQGDAGTTIVLTGSDNSKSSVTVAGSGATNVSYDTLSNTLTISSTDTNTDTDTTYTAGTGLTLSGTTFSVTANTYAPASHTHSYLPLAGGTLTGALNINSSTQGSDAFYVDGINGRLFTVTDDLSDSLFSVNTVAGLPVIEAFADNTVKIGPFTDPVTVDTSGLLYVKGNQVATQTYVNTAISNLIDGAPAALDTLNELAAAINDNDSYASTITTALADKAPLASPALTGTPTAPTADTATNTTQIATTAFVKAQGYIKSYVDTVTRLGTAAADLRSGDILLKGGGATSIAYAGGTFTISSTDTNTWRDIHDTPVDGATTTSISSNWAFDNVKTAVPVGAVFTDTVYTHPTTAGNKHIPSGGSSGQILRWSADGTATWGADNDTTYSDATASRAGLMSATDKSKLDGIAASANNYSLPIASATVLGGIKVGTNLSIDSNGVLSSTDTNTDTTYSAGTGLSLSGTTFSVTANTYAAASHTHGAADLPKQELGISIQGNFGQWMAHGTHAERGFNDNPTYWGWTFVQGNTAAPHTDSSQWYRGRFSLGDAYGLGTDTGDYWMEIAIPRYNYSTSGNMYIRTNESGTTGGWSGVRAVYAESAGAVAWDNVSSKPSTFAPSSHTHDDRYYTETEVDNLLAGKQAAGTYLTSLPSHDHDDRYFTETESDSRFLKIAGGTMTGTLTAPTIVPTLFHYAYGWRKYFKVRSVGVSGGSINGKWVHLFSVEIAGSYDKALIKAKLNGYDDVSIGTEVIHAIYENGGSTQENHDLYWYSIDNTASLFKAVKSIRTSASGLRNTYEVWAQMAGDWRDTFTMEVEFWEEENRALTFGAANGQDAEPTGDSNDIVKTSRQWAVNSNLYIGGNITLAGTVDGRDIATDGTKLDGIAANANNYSLPAASASTLGGIKIGTNLSIDTNGVVSSTDTNTWRPLGTGATDAAAGNHTHDDRYFTETESDSRFLKLAGGTLTGQLNLHAGNYEGSIVFGSQSIWRTGIRQHDDADAELRIWAKNANGMIFLATGYDGEPADIARPTDGLAIQGNKLGIGDFSTADPAYKLHVKGDIYANGGWVRVSGNDGLYFETHGGGWYMTDSSWIRSYGSKNVYVNAGFEVGSWIQNAGDYRTLNASNNGWNTTIYRNGGYPFFRGTTVGFEGARVYAPEGAVYTTGTSTVTGAFKIKLPTRKNNSSTMMRMTVKIYQYNTGNSYTIELGGYNYSGGNWYNIFAHQISDAGVQLTVRFGYDSTGDCIWIGETNSSWSYPQVYVTEFQSGYNSIDSDWATGWSITPVTSFDTVEQERPAAVTVTSRNVSSYALTSLPSHTHVWTDITDRPTNVSSFTNDSGYITSYVNTVTRVGVADDVSSGDIVIRGAGATTVTKNAGTITITSTDTDTNTWRPLGTGATDAAAGNHTHDDRYYTESEVDTLLGTKAASSHTHNIILTQGNYVWDASTRAGDYTTGIQTSFVRADNGWPNYGAVLHVGARGGGDAGGDFQLYMGHGSNYGGTSLRVRSADNDAAVSDSWTEWKTILDSSNVGDYALTALPSHTHDDRYYTESEVDTLLAGKLGSTAKAADSELLDGLDSSAYLRDDGWNNYPGQDANSQGVMRSDFTYGNNAPHEGELLRFGAGGYSTQINSRYGDGSQISFRTFNNDSVKRWNPWYEFIHSGNIGSQSVNYAGSAGSVAWGNVSDKPSTFSPSAHTHDDRYYTESEVDTLLAGKLGSTAKAADSELIDGIDSTAIVYGGAGRASSRVSSMNDTNQKSGFYYEYSPTGNPFGEWWNWMTVAGNSWQSSNNYSFQLAHNFHGDDFYVRRMTNGTASDWRKILDSSNIGSYAAAVSHTHDDRYYTESEVDTLLGTKAASSHTHGIGSITDASRWWNNFGNNHGTTRSFDATGGTLTTGFGWRYVQGNVNGPGTDSSPNQFYALTVGLGNEYDYNTYGMQLAIPRNTASPYISVRFEENRVLGGWQKISAGYADSAGSVAWSNVSGKPTTFSPSSHTHDDRYYTESEVNSLLNAKGDAIPVSQDGEALGNLASIVVLQEEQRAEFTTTSGTKFSVMLAG